MKNTKLELSVGIFVMLGIAALAYLTIQVGTGSMLNGDTYLIESRFANAGGLHTGSTVLLAGVTYLAAGSRITMTESAVDIESLIGKMAFGSVDKDKAQQETK